MRVYSVEFGSSFSSRKDWEFKPLPEISIARWNRRVRFEISFLFFYFEALIELKEEKKK